MKHRLSAAARLRRSLSQIVCLIAAGTGAGTALAQTEGCLFQVPTAWQALSVQWIGDCHDTYADGPGVLRVRGGNAPAQAFYGQLTRGSAQAGVLEGPKGLQAGRMVNGAWTPAKTKAEQTAAWRSGLEAARKTSAYFRTAGVTRAADDYAQAAERIERAAGSSTR